MPALVWCGRRWRTATDDFTFSSVLNLCLLSISAGFTLWLWRRKDPTTHTFSTCPQPFASPFERALLAVGCVDAAAAALFAVTAVLSLRGSVFEMSKRRAVPWLLYADAAVVFAMLALSAVCTWYGLEQNEVSLCSRTTRSIVRLTIGLSFVVSFLFILPFAVAFDPDGHKHYRNLDDYAQSWGRRASQLCCCFVSKEEKDDTYHDLGQVMASAFRGYDIVPSDIAAGVLLLHGYQQRSRRIISGRMHYPAAGDGKKERVSSQACPAKRLTPEQRALVHEVYTYAPFFMAAYGWWGYVFDSKCCIGAPKLCCYDPLCCCRHYPGKIYGTGGYLCDLITVLKKTGIEEEDVLLSSWDSSLYKPVYYVAYDRKTNAVVIVIRGTMSLGDCVTDLAAMPQPLKLADHDPTVAEEEYYAHRGWILCARYVMRCLEYNGVLPLFHTGARYGNAKIVVTGHSLGGGVALVLSAMLWSNHVDLRRRLRCIAYAPPGASVSAAVAEYMKDFTVGCFMGYDMIPRLALHTFDRFRESLFDVLAASHMPKSLLFLNFMRTSEVAKPIHPSTPTSTTVLAPGTTAVRTGIAGGVSPSEESMAYRTALYHAPCVPSEEPKKLFNCNTLIHFRKVVKRCDSLCATVFSRYNTEVYIPVIIGPEDVQMLLSSPTMWTDHFPKNIFPVMRDVVEQMDKGELDRFYTDDYDGDAAHAPELEAPMHFVHSPVSRETDSGYGTTTSTGRERRKSEV